MRDKQAEMNMRVAVHIALGEMVRISRATPANVFYLHAIPCPGCHRHAAALAMSFNEFPFLTGEKPKYILATVVNGEVIGRNQRRH